MLWYDQTIVCDSGSVLMLVYYHVNAYTMVKMHMNGYMYQLVGFK